MATPDRGNNRTRKRDNQNQPLVKSRSPSPSFSHSHTHTQTDTLDGSTVVHLNTTHTVVNTTHPSSNINSCCSYNYTSCSIGADDTHVSRCVVGSSSCVTTQITKNDTSAYRSGREPSWEISSDRGRNVLVCCGCCNAGCVYNICSLEHLNLGSTSSSCIRNGISCCSGSGSVDSGCCGDGNCGGSGSKLRANSISTEECDCRGQGDSASVSCSRSFSTSSGGDRLTARSHTTSNSNRSLEDSVCDVYNRSVSSPTQKLASSSLRIASGVSVSYSTSESNRNLSGSHRSHVNTISSHKNVHGTKSSNTTRRRQQQHTRNDTSSNARHNTGRSSPQTPLDEVFDTVPDFPKLVPLSKLVSSQAPLSSSSSSNTSSNPSSSSSTSPSSSRLPLLWRRRRSKQSNSQNSGVTSFLPRQSSIVEEDEQQQQQQQRQQQTTEQQPPPKQNPSIIHKIFLRASEDLNSWDKHKVKNAKLMLKRLVHVGVCIRPKAMSYPNPQSPIPIITVTHHTYTPPCQRGTEPPSLKQIPVQQPPSSQPQSNTDTDKDITPKNVTRSASGTFLHQRHLLTSASIPDLTASNGHQQGSNRHPFLDDLGHDVSSSATRRKDSVSRIRKKSLVQAAVRRPSNASMGSLQIGGATAQVARRNSSVCGSITTSRGTASPSNDQSNGPYLWRADDDSNLFTWSCLMAAIPPEDRKGTPIRRHQVLCPIPVCLVGEDKPVSFTSIEVIEQTLRRLHPDIIVKKRTPSKQQEVSDCDSQQQMDEQTQEDKPPARDRRVRRLSVTVPPYPRRQSINTCITTMRTGLDDYDKQLTGVKSVGTFAEEEELKVLMAKRDAIACVIDAMKSYPMKEELQISACISLQKMASVSESNCVHILNNEGLKPIANTLRLHNYNVDIVRPLLSTIAFISTAHNLSGPLVSEGVHSEVLQAMAVHGNDADIVRESCYIIGNLLQTVDIAQQLMYAAAVHTIIRLVDNFPTEPRILENACRTLGSFAIYDETCQDVANAGATGAVINSITSPHANADVIECGLWALASLTAVASTCEEVVYLGGVKVILQVLSDYPREEGLQDYGMRVLYNLSLQDETASSVSEERVFRLLYDAMLNFRLSVELLEIVLVTLCQMLIHCEALCRCVVDTCFVRDLVNIMLEYPDNTLIQEHGCKVLGNLAVEEDLRKLAESQGASRAVISALLTNNTDGSVQEIGCVAIMNLTADNRENKVRIKNAGAVSAILNCLQEFQCDPIVVLAALKALGNLINLEEVCHLLLDEKGLSILVSLSDIYEDDQEMLVFLSMVFCGMAELPDLKEEEVEQIDDTLTQMSGSSQYCENIAQNVCQAMEKLIRTPQGRDTFQKRARLQCTLQTMNQFPANVDIHRTCCRLIAGVSYYLDNTKKRLITETTVNTVLKSMELFPFDLDLQIIACGTISCIVQKIAILKHQLIGHGGITLLRKAMTNHRTESRLAAIGLITLGYILPINPKTYPLEGRAALDIILMCMKNFPENEEIQLVGCHALGECQNLDVRDTQDLSNIIIQALRRHGEDPEMQRKSAKALKNANTRCTESSSIIQKTLASPKLFVTDEFWKIWDGN